MSVTLDIPGRPVPLARPRVVRDRRGRTWAYTSPRSRAWMRTVAATARAAGWRVRSDLLAVTLAFRMPTRRRADADNLAKAVLDALTGIAWADDSQIAVLTVTRTYEPADPGVTVRIGDLPKEETA